MGSSHLLPLSPPLHYQTLNPAKTSLTLKFLPVFPISSNPRPDQNAIRAGRFDFDDGFGFGGRKKRRNWCSDDDDEDEDEDEDEFWEEPSSFDWLFKALRAFGWMIPAVLISALLGTGTNSMIMALVLPLGQTALSLVMDKLWGGPSSSPDPRPRSKSRSRSRARPRPRPRRNPTVGTANGTQANEETREPGARHSWQTTNSGSAKKGGKTSSRFGGWDELDEQTRSSSFSREEQKRNTDDLPRENSGTGKLSRRRNREKPLLMRLLIAVFPFMGSWTRFFF